MTKDGMFRKFDVRRCDGKDAPGQKHEHCFYYVLDMDHDEFAIPAMRAYAEACQGELPELASQIHQWCDEREGINKPTFSVTMRLLEPTR